MTDPHNEADTYFVRMSIPHHQQGIEMAQLATERADADDVRHFAQHVAESQAPEVDMFHALLDAWGESAPQESATEMDMPGTMSTQEMSRLRELAGEQFDTAFLHDMLDHHEAMIDMARKVLDEGQHEGVKSMASSSIEEQQQDISTMRRLLPA